MNDFWTDIGLEPIIGEQPKKPRQSHWRNYLDYEALLPEKGIKFLPVEGKEHQELTVEANGKLIPILRVKTRNSTTTGEDSQFEMSAKSSTLLRKFRQYPILRLQFNDWVAVEIKVEDLTSGYFVEQKTKTGSIQIKAGNLKMVARAIQIAELIADGENEISEGARMFLDTMIGIARGELTKNESVKRLKELSDGKCDLKKNPQLATDIIVNALPPHLTRHLTTIGLCHQ